MWDIWQAIRHLEARIKTLEAENVNLRHQLHTVKRPLRVKKLVYHVHSLHIQEMKGTMNIGLTAPLSEDEMEQMVLDMQEQKD